MKTPSSYAVVAFATAIWFGAQPATAGYFIQRLSGEVTAGRFSNTVTTLSNGSFALGFINFVGNRTDVAAQVFSHVGVATSEIVQVQNTPSRTERRAPDIAALAPPRNGFVVAWQYHATQPESRDGLNAQLLDNQGNKIGANFRLNAAQSGSQDSVSLGSFSNGGWVASFTSRRLPSDDSLGDICLRIFNPDGTASGNILANRVIRQGSQRDSSVAVLSNGDIVVVWSDFSQAAADRQGAAIRGRIFRRDGTPVGNGFIVNTTTDADQTAPAVASIGEGRFVVVWQDGSQNGPDAFGFSVRGQVMSGTGARLGDEFVVPVTMFGDQTVPAIAGFSDGKFVVAWRDVQRTPDFTRKIRAQAFRWTIGASAPQRLGNEFPVNQIDQVVDEAPDVATFPSTDFVITFGGKAQVYRIGFR
jgi:hypothetical protein